MMGLKDTIGTSVHQVDDITRFQVRSNLLDESGGLKQIHV